MSSALTSSSVIPVQPESAGSSARYSWAVSPIEAALTRSGRSLLTRTTSSPSASRLRATDRIRVSLSPSRNPGGQYLGITVVQLDPDGSALVTDRQVGIQPAEFYPQVIQVPEGLTGEIAQFGVMTLGLQLGDDDDGQDHAVLGEPADRGRVGEQDAGVQHVAEPVAPGYAGSPTVLVSAGIAGPRYGAGRRTGHSFSPGPLTWRHARTQMCLQDRDRPSKGQVPALRSSRLRVRTRSSRMSRAFPGGRLGTAHLIERYPGRAIAGRPRRGVAYHAGPGLGGV